MATTNFNTTNATFRQLLGNGLTYQVPRFQRDYSWTEDEWEDLWQDIVDLFSPEGEGNDHYLGYLVLQSSDSKQFAIIDGQQRLTTISLLILAGLSHLQDLIATDLDAANNRRRSEQLRNSYIGYLDPVTLVPRSKLELNRHNNNYYQSYLVPIEKLPQRHLKASEHLLRRAFIWFKERLKKYCGMTDRSGTDLARLIDSLVDRLFFTVITVTDELNAFKVFETLNSRGVKLSVTDLLKNHLFSLIDNAPTHATELESLEERWENIVGLLGSESFPEFLRVFWNSKNKLVRKSDLFKTIRRRITSKAEAFALVRDLDAAVAIYAALGDPQDPTWNPPEKAALEELKLFRVRQPIAMLLACFDRFWEPDRAAFTHLLQAIAVISFRYNVIGNLLTQTQEQIYNDIAVKVSHHTYTQVDQIMNALRVLYPQDQEFKAAFGAKELRTTDSRNKKIVRYSMVRTDFLGLRYY